MVDSAVNVFAGLVFVGPALVWPAIAGFFILTSYPDDPLGKLAGFFTLKPLVATPLWVMLLLFPQVPGGPANWSLWSLLPGAVLTLMIVANFWRLFAPPSLLASAFLAFDVLRWGTTFMLVGRIGRDADLLFFLLLIAAYLLPSGYGAIAWVVLIVRQNRRRMATQEPPAVPVL